VLAVLEVEVLVDQLELLEVLTQEAVAVVDLELVEKMLVELVDLALLLLSMRLVK
jgi:hypothetical protein